MTTTRTTTTKTNRHLSIYPADFLPFFFSSFVLTLWNVSIFQQPSFTLLIRRIHSRLYHKIFVYNSFNVSSLV
jgi:hypothetical protein